MDILKSDKFEINKKQQTDGLILLSEINDTTIKTAFFDPQYRGVLDKLSYGNEGVSRGKARSELPQMNEDTIVQFLKEIHRTLIPSGYLFLWVDKFHLCQGINAWLKEIEFQIVDMIVWDKCKMGMGYRSRRKAEYLIVLQKPPIKAKSTWSDHAIPDVWGEKTPKTHAHSKPIELQKRLIMSTSNEGDYILDPASGGYSVFEACKLSNRNFIGGDLIYGE